jgi:ribosome-associated protein
MIRINARIGVDEREISESFMRAAGPGGQNVNKVATAVELRFDVRRSPSLPDDVRSRLVKLAGRRMTHEGVLVITARRHRTQERNRQEARRRLIDLIRRAAAPPTQRVPTKPTMASRQRRRIVKQRHSATKALRSEKPAPD